MLRQAMNKLSKQEKLFKEIEFFLEQAPPGYLKIQERKGKVYYYQMLFDRETKLYTKKYIPREKQNLASALAQKGYYLSIKPILEKQLLALRRFCTEYSDGEMLNSEYDHLTKVRQMMVQPVSRSLNSKIEEWKNEIYIPNQKYPEGLIFDTENKEKVRSKSELMIANSLYYESRILYKYERPLELKSNGKVVVFYPDFTIINMHTGKITYWEHAGKMDDPVYASEFVKKINIYLENGIIPGENLIITYETRDSPLLMRTVKNMLETIV